MLCDICDKCKPTDIVNSGFWDKRKHADIVHCELRRKNAKRTDILRLLGQSGETCRAEPFVRDVNGRVAKRAMQTEPFVRDLNGRVAKRAVQTE